MPARKKLLITFFFTLAIFLFFPREVFAAFSFSIVNAEPNSINSKDQEILVNLSIIDLPSGDSYFRVGIQRGNLYIGYIKNNKGEWVKLKSLSEDKESQLCQNYFKVTGGLSSLSLSLKVGDDNEIENGSYNLRAHRFTSTCGSYAASNEAIPIAITINLPTPTPTPVLTSTPTLTPTPTLMPTSAPTSLVKAGYKINEVKDKNGKVLSNVKIYVDGVYVHHYAPETLTFCDSCKCDTYVDCGFGSHTIELQKADYQDWTEEINIKAGDNLEVNPVMEKEEEVTSTPASTPTPKPPTLTPTKKVTPTPTPTEKVATKSGEILGEEEEATIGGFYPLEATEEARKAEEATSAGSKRSKILGGIFIGAGLIALFGVAFSLWYTKLR